LKAGKQTFWLYPLRLEGTGFMSSDEWSLYRLRVVADADPGALARVLERFQNLNICPRKVLAELSTTELFHVEVIIGGVSSETIAIIAGKLGEVPCIRSAQFHPF
jgi:hypothetical protein